MQNRTRVWQLVRSQFFHLKPTNAWKFHSNFLAELFFTLYSSLDYVFPKFSWSTFSLTRPFDQWACKNFFSQILYKLYWSKIIWAALILMKFILTLSVSSGEGRDLFSFFEIVCLWCWKSKLLKYIALARHIHCKV